VSADQRSGVVGARCDAEGAAIAIDVVHIEAVEVVLTGPTVNAPLGRDRVLSGEAVGVRPRRSWRVDATEFAVGLREGAPIDVSEHFGVGIAVDEQGPALAGAFCAGTRRVHHARRRGRWLY